MKLPKAHEGADRDPVRVYLAGRGPGSRRTLAGALKTILEIGEDNGRVLDIHDGNYHQQRDTDRLSRRNTVGDSGLLGGLQLQGFPWHRLRYQHCQAIRTALAAQYAPATANKILSALKGVLQECWRLGQMDAETYHRAVDLSPVKGETVPRGRALPRAELDRLFSVCRADAGPTGRRDLAIFAVCYGTGLRRQEVAGLNLEDYDSATSCLVVNGKGTKCRTVYIKNGLRAALEAWIEARGTVAQAAGSEANCEVVPVMNGATPGVIEVRGSAWQDALPKRAVGALQAKAVHVEPREPALFVASRGKLQAARDPLFLSTGGRGRGLTGKGMSADAIYDVCKARGRQAGIEGFSPHDLRRTAISDMLDAGADLSAVKAVAGHSKIDTTSRYDRRGERAKEQAASLLEV